MPSFLVQEKIDVPSYDIIKNDGKTQKKQKITVYNDDTVLEIMNKIAIKEGFDYKYIFAWFQDTGNKILPLSFISDFSLQNPFQLKEFFDKNFVNKEGTRISTGFQSLYHTLIQNVSLTNEIHYCTIFDYLKYYKIKNELNDDEIRKVLKIEPKLFFLGNLKLYWKDLTKEDIQKVKETKYQKRFKEVKELTENNSEITDLFHKDLGSKMIYHNEFQPISLVISNEKDVDSYNLNVIKLFTDFHLCDINNHQIIFAKLYLDETYNSYYKVNKDKISVRKDDTHLMNEDRFVRWTKGIVTSVPNVSNNYLGFKNTLSYKIVDKGNTYFTLLIRETGSIECIFERTGEKILTREFIKEKIKFINDFIRTIINKEKIYHNYELGDIPFLKDKIYGPIDRGVSLLSGHLYYDMKDYRKDILENALHNLISYTRFNRSVENWIHGTYKRVNNYDSIDTKLLVITKFAQDHDDKKHIISLIGEYFGLIEEDASDEYDNWLETRESGNFKMENGIDFMIEGVKSSHIRISIGECANYDEFRRIHHFFNMLMSVYYELIETKKDIFGIFNKKRKQRKRVIEEDLMQSIDNEMMSSEIHGSIEEGIEDIIEESKKSKSKKEDSLFSDLSEESGEEIGLSDMSSAESEVSKKDSKKDSKKSSSKSSESSLSEEFSMDLLDESSGSSGSSTGGGKRMVGGGFDIRSYYLNRMTKNPRYDNELFDFETGKVHKSNKSGEQKYTYARTCSTSLGRQPIAITASELQKIKDDPEHGEGIGYNTAIKVPNREPINGEEIFYICPKYWDVKNEIPKNPMKIDEFKENVAGMDYRSGEGVPVKLKAKDKMNSDKYILVRNEGDYWNNAGDDISRYNIELIENFHPQGYGLPCCNMPRLEKLSRKDKIEVFLELKGKKEWRSGSIIELGTDGKPTKKNLLKPYKVALQNSDKIYEVLRKDIRKKKSTSYISNYVPCNIGQQCHVSQTIKSFFGLSKDSPGPNTGNMGLVRKGIKQTHRSLLTSLCLSLRNSSTDDAVKELIRDILFDVKNHPLIYELGNGSFVNRFKSNIYEIPDDDISEFLSFIKHKKLKGSHFDRYLKQGNKKKFLNGPKNNARLVLHYYNEFSSIKNLERYLLDDKFSIEDSLLTRLLISLSRMKESKTFYAWKKKTKGLKKLGIFVFEEVIDKIKINIPDGDINLNYDECLLFFKKGTIYEPISFKFTDKDYSFIGRSVEELPDKRIHILEKLRKFILEKNIKKNNSLKNIINAQECIRILLELGLDVNTLLYDDYNKIRYIETEKNVFIPVKPSSLEDIDEYKKVYTGKRIIDKNYPIYDDVIQILKKIDSNINKDLYHRYLGEKTGISTRGEWTNRGGMNYHLISVTEIVVHNVSYIPVQKEEYSRKKHMDIISLNNLYDCDKSLVLQSYTNDDRNLFIQKHSYENSFISNLYRKLYILLINEKELKDKILEIKRHDIKLDLHKKLELYPIVKEMSKVSIKVTEKEFFYGCPIVEDDKVLYYNELKDEIKSIENILKYFVVLLVNYSEEDYERFIKIETDLTKLYETLEKNELLFSHEQFLDEEYFEYFHSKSDYANSFNLYNERVPQKSLAKIYGKKHRFKPVIFDKKYPKIVGEKIHKRAVLIKHQLLDITNLDIILYSMKEEFDKPTKEKLLMDMIQLIKENNSAMWVLEEEEMNVQELYEKFMGNKYESLDDIIEDLQKETHEINVPDLFLISHITNKSFVLLSSLYSKMVSHDTFIIINPMSLGTTVEETEMYCFYQNKNYLANIMIGTLMGFPLIDLSNEFQKELKKTYRDLYDFVHKN